MNIVCATDDNFVQHCCVMLVSLLKNNEDVVVYLLTEGLSSENQLILEEEVKNYGGKYHCIIVDSSIISRLPMPKESELGHISPATYYRLLVSDILPSYVDKVIYLDCDIVIRNSIQELWDTNIEEYAIAGVSQIPTPNGYSRLNYEMKYGYFNAGVLLLNISYWRENNISEKLINYLVKNYHTIKYHDQDALNALLHKVRLTLPCKWNMLFPYFDRKIYKVKDIENGQIINDFSDYKKGIKINRKDPVLLHYTAKPKPWDKGCIHPYRSEYFKYARLTKNFNNIKKPSELVSVTKIIIRNIKLFVRGIIIKGN